MKEGAFKKLLNDYIDFRLRNRSQQDIYLDIGPTLFFEAKQVLKQNEDGSFSHRGFKIWLKIV